MKNTLPVILNVYKINEDSILTRLGIKLYHTAIEYDNSEYSYGYDKRPNMNGIYDIPPMSYEDGTFVESITLGTATRREFFTKYETVRKMYMANEYQLLTKNCNHFTNDLSKILFGKEIPFKYSTFLKVGEFFRKFC